MTLNISSSSFSALNYASKLQLGQINYQPLFNSAQECVYVIISDCSFFLPLWIAQNFQHGHTLTFLVSVVDSVLVRAKISSGRHINHRGSQYSSFETLLFKMNRHVLECKQLRPEHFCPLELHKNPHYAQSVTQASQKKRKKKIKVKKWTEVFQLMQVKVLVEIYSWHSLATLYIQEVLDLRRSQISPNVHKNLCHSPTLTAVAS